MRADIAWGQIQGARNSQQDSAACLSWPTDLHLLVLADGIGGYPGGDVASQTVVTSFRDAFVGSPDLPTRARLVHALQEANLALFDRAQNEARLKGMGTTIVAAGVETSSLYWVSVGDSPLWLFRNGEMRRLNEDHSVGGMLDKKVETGEISANEAANASDRSNLLDAVQGNDISLVDAPHRPVQLCLGDIVIVASDGVETCASHEIEEIVGAGHRSSANLADDLLAAVESCARPGQDNTTVIVLRLNAEEAEE